jgi:hypothetical protein
VLLQARQSIFEETLSPQADDFPPGVEASGNLIVGPTIRGEEDHLSANHFKIRQRIFGGATAQFLLLGGREHYRVWARAWHREGLLDLHDAIREWIFNQIIR